MADEQEQDEERGFLEGYQLNVDSLISNEIITCWPMKILCKEDCKGLCSVCGQNLNEGTCDCEDTGLDPRMSVIQDILNSRRRCKPCLSVQRINLLKLEETAVEQTGR